MTADEIIKEQQAYYRARAPEYDEWWLRRGRYDRGAALNEQWFSEGAAVAKALEDFRPGGRILEFAAGTGIWSQCLLPFASKLVLVDGSREALDIAAARLHSPKVDYIQANIFDWRPTGQFDIVFFSFWLSHVPPERFDEFWDLVGRCLAPAGRVFFIDSRPDENSTSSDQPLPASNKTVMERRLNDGREFRIIKVFYDMDELLQRLTELGWRMNVSKTEHYFLYGSGSPA